MFKIIISVFLFNVCSIHAQSWGFNIGGFSFSSNNNNCYPTPVVTYMPQNVYMRPYQYMPAPQPVIITPPIYYNNIVVPRYNNNRCYNNRW
jgi:hypothetical protein